jgi:hypothetical protein
MNRSQKEETPSWWRTNRHAQAVTKCALASATEAQLAAMVCSYLPPLRTVGKVWYLQQDDGIWRSHSRHEFSPLVMACIHPSRRTARLATRVLRFIEATHQIERFNKEDEP